MMAKKGFGILVCLLFFIPILVSGLDLKPGQIVPINFNNITDTDSFCIKFNLSHIKISPNVPVGEFTCTITYWGYEDVDLIKGSGSTSRSKSSSPLKLLNQPIELRITRPAQVIEKEVIREVGSNNTITKEVPVDVIKEVPVEKIVTELKFNWIMFWIIILCALVIGYLGYVLYLETNIKEV